MPQFSLKRLFVSVTLIAVGCALLVVIQRRESLGRPEYTRSIIMLCALIGPSLIGAGIGNIFKRAAHGLLFIWLAIFVCAVVYFSQFL
jgi:hypothetical protein